MRHDITLPHGASLASPALDIVSAQAMKALFWRLKFLRPTPILFHTPFLFWLTEATRPRQIVDLGTGAGVAHLAFCQAIEKLNLETRCVGIDTWEDGIPQDLVLYNAEQYEEFGTLLRADLIEAATRFADGSVDILNVGMPLEDTALEALRDAWLPKLSEAGVMLIHGTGSQPLSPANRQTVRQLEANHPMISFEHGEGLSVFLVGPAQADRVLKLAALKFGQGGHGDAQHIFRRLGVAMHLEWRSRNEADRATALQQQLDDLLAQFDGRPRAAAAAYTGADAAPSDRTQTASQAELEAARARLAGIEPRHLDALSQMNRALTDAGEHNIRQAEEIAALTARLEQRSEGTPIRVHELESELSRSRMAQRDLTDQNHKAQAEIQDLRRRAAEAEDRVQDILNSTSWRITKPARSLIMLTRRGK
ncbi:MAG: hypothetical protein ACJASV_000924 [Pseudorhodobacter sp.]|jgi:hypothetical protein